MGKRLYVRNFGELTKTENLVDLFSSVGEVVSAVIELKLIRSTQYRVAYIEMATESAAADGILRFHGQKIDGLVLIVTEDKPHIPGPAALPKVKAKTVPKQKIKKPLGRNSGRRFPFG